MEFMNVKEIPQQFETDIFKLLVLCDREFIPPLSVRKDTIQKELRMDGADEKPYSYFEKIKNQPAVLTLENNHVIAFISFIRDYIFNETSEELLPNIYISTLLVHPENRHKGIAGRLYNELLKSCKGCHVFTRTWSTNLSQIKLLLTHNFHEHVRIYQDRGADIDTVYFYKAPTYGK